MDIEYIINDHIIIIMSIEWRIIDDYPNYEVNNNGEIKCNEQIVKLIKRGEYRVVNLHNKGSESSIRYVHRIVAVAFIPNPDNKRVVDHINNIKSDNRLENLRWTTQSENCINIPTRAKNRHIYSSSPRSHLVKILRNGKWVFNKRFSTLEEAIAARDNFIEQSNNSISS
jgi:hypothetical protein